MSEELKPCPFCGCAARAAFPGMQTVGFVYCMADCGAEMRRPWREQAIAAWNTRHES